MPFLREVMTPETVEKWTAALKYGQQLNDRLLKSDWDTNRLANPRQNTADTISRR